MVASSWTKAMRWPSGDQRGKMAGHRIPGQPHDVPAAEINDMQVMGALCQIVHSAAPRSLLIFL